jgi:ATP-dependent DNA helicase HFM1/MER3
MVELEQSAILQMIGRAGRPQFDDSAVAVILTRSDKRPMYENLVTGKQPLESRLHLQLVEHLNSEIGLGTIYDLQSAKNWLRSTFYYIRCHSNPTHYGITPDSDAVEQKMEQLCLQSVNLLKNDRFVEEINGKLQTTSYGEAAAKYCCRLATMTRILGMKEQAKLKDVVCLNLNICDFID